MPTDNKNEAASPSGSRFAYDSESGYIFDTLKNEWIDELIEAGDLLNEYADREKKCATLDEAEKIALIRALQEIGNIVGFLGAEHSPKELVEAVGELKDQLRENHNRAEEIIEAREKEIERLRFENKVICNT